MYYNLPKQPISRVQYPLKRDVVIHLCPGLAAGLLRPNPFRLHHLQWIRGGPSRCGTYLALLQAGFTKLFRLPGILVSSYLSRCITCIGNPDKSGHLFTLSPNIRGGFPFCGTFLPVAGTPCYGAPCPMELGLSSPSCFIRMERPPVLLQQSITIFNYYIIFF